MLGIFLLGIVLKSSAYDFKVGDFYYSISDKAARLVNVVAGETKYAGNIIIPETVENAGVVYTVYGIGSSAFYECPMLQSVDIPNSVTSLGSDAFYNCNALTRVSIGNNLKVVSQNAFKGCEALESVVLGSKVESLGYRAFSGCVKLKDINLNDNIISFSDNVFADCVSLTNVVLGKSVQSMGVGVFSGCTNITGVEIRDGATVIGSSAFYECIKLQSVDIPNSVTSLGSDAFCGCKALTRASIGNNLKVVSQNAFKGCVSLQSVSLGSDIKSLGYRVFDGCNYIKTLTLMSPEPPTIGDYAFSNYKTTLRVPAQSVSLYKEHEGWKKFEKIEAIEDQLYLTIRQADANALRLAVNVGQTYCFDILPDDKWLVHSVTFNGEDVTQQMVDGSYTTPALTTNSTLIVVFEDKEDGILSPQNSNVRVYGESDGTICINNLADGEMVYVYDTNGRMVRQETASSEQMRIKLDNHGVYIVKAGVKTLKLNL
jgi:hypothetical protein